LFASSCEAAHFGTTLALTSVEMKPTAQKAPKTQFWMMLASVNMAAIAYPIDLYVRADSNETQLYAALLILGVAFFLAIADTVTAIVLYATQG
jgi:hypothetical protein